MDGFLQDSRWGRCYPGSVTRTRPLRPIASLVPKRLVASVLRMSGSAGQDDGLIDHVSIRGADVPRSLAFYDAVLAPLGGTRVLDVGQVVGFGIAPNPDFWIGPRSTGEGFRESHIAFTATSRDAVDAFFAAARAAGAKVLHE